MKKNTILDLWKTFVNSIKEDDSGSTVLRKPFLGWKTETNADEIMKWFDAQTQDFGGLNALRKGKISEDKHFVVHTPSGTMSVWAKYEGKAPEDYPGVYVDLLSDDQPETDKYGNLLCCVEYDSAKGLINIIPYADIKCNEPCFGSNIDDCIIRVAGTETHN